MHRESGLLRRIVIRVWHVTSLCLQVALAFGSIWIVFTALTNESPGWFQYPIALVCFVGAITILYPELQAVGAILLLPSCISFLVIKLAGGGDYFTEIVMVSLAAIIAMINYEAIGQLLRPHRLGDHPSLRAPWWRKVFRYAFRSTLVLVIVSVSFYLVKNSEWGKHDIRGTLALDQGRYEQAISDFNESLKLANKFPRSNWRAIQATYKLGLVYARNKQYVSAEAAFRDALSRSQKELDPRDEHYVLYYRSMDALAFIYGDQSRHPEAEAIHLQAIASYSTWSSPPSDMSAFVTFLKGAQKVALVLHQEYIAMDLEEYIKNGTDFDLNTQIHGLPAALDSLAGFYLRQHEYRKAEQYFKRGLVLKTQILGRQFPTLGRDLLDFRVMTDDQGKPLEGLALYGKIRPYLFHMSVGNRSEIGESLNQIGLTYWEQGRNQEAEPLYLLSLAIDRSCKKELSPSYAMTLTNLGLLYNSMGRYAEAEPKLLAALEIRERILDANHPDLGHSYSNLAHLYDKLNQTQKAEPLYARALSIRQRSLGPSHPKSVLTMDLFARMLFRDAQYAKAEPLFVELLRLQQQELGISHPEVLGLKWKLAGIYSEQRKYQEAISMYEGLIGQIEEQDPYGSLMRQVLSSFEYVVRKAGNRKRADDIKKRIRELVEGTQSFPMAALKSQRNRKSQ